jgi:hypothetical protein
MDVLQEIFRSNGRSVNLLQHKKITVGKERDLYYVRGEHVTGTREVVTVYLTESEVDQLIELRNRKVVELHAWRGVSNSIREALAGLVMIEREK